MNKLLYNSIVLFLCYLLGQELMPSYIGGWLFSWAAGLFIGLVDMLESRERRKCDDNL